MKRFIELKDIDGTLRYLNVRHIASVEPHDKNTKVNLAMPGRGIHPFYSFIAEEQYDIVIEKIG